MALCKSCGKQHNVGFVATRLAGTDGVSLETEKWVTVFEELGLRCFYFAGEVDHSPQRSFQVAEAHFSHPEIREIYSNCFGTRVRGRLITRKISESKRRIKDQLYQFLQQFEIDLLVPENALTIPLNLPLGIALTEVIAETGIPVIAHHHDFFWERQRFMTNAVWDYLNMAFPPHLPTVRHVVINSSADNQLSLRTGISATLIPNVMDFETPPPAVPIENYESCAPRIDAAPPAADDYAADVRQALGLRTGELLVLQPTRVVKRKGIEHAIELVNRLQAYTGLKAKLIISHASGDEGYDYENRVRQYSALLGVDTRFVSRIINENRGLTPGGRKIYTLEDIYPHADLVTYPSSIEGFGNAFLEAVYFCKPIVVNTYAIYELDIKPKGFSVIEMDGYVSEETVRSAAAVLRDPDLRRKMVQHNYQMARKYFSYSVLYRKLTNLLSDSLGCHFSPPVASADE